MSQIFLFTKGAKIGNETRKQLRENGIIPVEVESLDQVRLLAASIPEVDSGVILRAAMRAIRSAVEAENRKEVVKMGHRFAVELTAALSKEPAS